MLKSISTIFEQLKKSKKPLLAAVFLAIGLITAGMQIPGVRAVAEEGPWVSAVQAPQDPWLNPSLGALKAQTVFSSSQVRLALPADMSQVALLSPSVQPSGANSNATSQNSDQAKTQTYVVKKGDVLSKVTEKFGVSISDLVNANPVLKKNKNVRVGQQLTIPALSDSGSGAQG